MAPVKMETKSAGSNNGRSAASSRSGKRLRDLQRNLHVLSAVVRRVLEQTPVESLPDSPITSEQLRLLRFVVSKSDAQVGQVAAGLGITPASASLALDRLEALGYVERRKRNADRRSVQVVATRSGRGVVSRVRRIVDAKLAKTLERVGVRDSKRFVDLAAEMTRALMEDEEFFGDICMQCGAGCSKNCVIHEMFEDVAYPD